MNVIIEDLRIQRQRRAWQRENCCGQAFLEKNEKKTSNVEAVYILSTTGIVYGCAYVLHQLKRFVRFFI